MVLTIFIVATVTFFLMKLLPGSPLRNQEKLTKEQVAIIEEQYGLNKPYIVQYSIYISSIVRGDFGVSFQYDNREVRDMIVTRIGPSAQLGVQALLFGVPIGLLLGIVAALRHNTTVDYMATVIAVIGASVPSFVLGGFLQYFFAVKFQWFPVAFWEGFRYTILPTLAMSASIIAYMGRFMRTEMIEVLNSDYISFAKSKGTSTWGVVLGHGVRNALLPVITVLGPITVSVITGSLVIERIFAIPGLGDLFVGSINMLDYPVIMGTTIFYCSLFVIVLFVIDVLYGIIDPRIRLNAKGGQHG